MKLFIIKVRRLRNARYTRWRAYAAYMAEKGARQAVIDAPRTGSVTYAVFQGRRIVMDSQGYDVRPGLGGTP